MHEALAIRILALFGIIAESWGVAREQSVEYYIGAPLFQHCNRIIYFYLGYSERFAKIIQPDHQHFRPMLILSNGLRNGLTHEVAWSRRSICLLHIVIHRTYAGRWLRKMTLFWDIRASHELEFVLFFVAQPWRKMATERADFLGRKMRRSHEVSPTKLIQLLRLSRNWLICDMDIDTFDVIEANAVCPYCTPDLVACTCPTAALLLDSSKFFMNERRTDFNRWPLYFHIRSAGLRLRNYWPMIRQLPLRSLFSRDHFALPLYQICSNIGQHLNATMVTLTTTTDYDRGRSGTMIFFGAWFEYNPHVRELTVAVEGLRFSYCTNRTDAFVGDTRALFAPFDVATWACTLTALGGMSAVFRIKHGQVNLFHLLACLFLQGRIFMGRLALLWVLWIVGAGTLQNFYTSFIESVLVAPPEASRLNNFEQLYAAGYHIVMGAEEPMVKDVKRGFYGGTSYLDALKDSVEYIGENMFDREFLLFVLNKEKKAFFLAGAQAPAVRKALGHSIPWKDCHVSKSELPLVSKGWAAMYFKASYVRALFHRLFVSGISKLFMSSSERKWNGAFEKNIRSAICEAFYGARSGTAGCGIEQDSQNERKDDGAALDFTIGSSQLKMIFVLWLSTLGLSVIIFCVERSWGKMGKLIRYLSCRTSAKEGKWAVSRVGL